LSVLSAGKDRCATHFIVLGNESELYTRRWQAAKVLGALKAKRAVPELLTVVEGDGHRVVTAVAAEALGRIGDRSVLSRLKRALEEERDHYVRPALEQAIKALENG
jgi:HEAT repeat protein